MCYVGRPMVVKALKIILPSSRDKGLYINVKALMVFFLVISTNNELQALCTGVASLLLVTIGIKPRVTFV